MLTKKVELLTFNKYISYYVIKRKLRNCKNISTYCILNGAIRIISIRFKSLKIIVLLSFPPLNINFIHNSFKIKLCYTKMYLVIYINNCRSILDKISRHRSVNRYCLFYLCWSNCNKHFIKIYSTSYYDFIFKYYYWLEIFNQYVDTHFVFRLST